jgi:hypothetical protein
VQLVYFILKHFISLTTMSIVLAKNQSNALIVLTSSQILRGGINMLLVSTQISPEKGESSNNIQVKPEWGYAGIRRPNTTSSPVLISSCSGGHWYILFPLSPHLYSPSSHLSFVPLILFFYCLLYIASRHDTSYISITLISKKTPLS